MIDEIWERRICFMANGVNATQIFRFFFFHRSNNNGIYQKHLNFLTNTHAFFVDGREKSGKRMRIPFFRACFQRNL